MQPDSHLPDEQTPKESPAPLPVYTPSPSAVPQPGPVVTLAPDGFSAVGTTLDEPEAPISEDPEGDDVPGEEPVRWQAHEYVHHEKSPIWFIIFAIVVTAFMAVAVFVIKDISFAILVPVMAAALLVYANRPPRLLDYTLSRHGLHINDRLYSFADFKGFRVIHDGEEYSVMLIPIKRFKPGVSVYFPEEAGEAIVDMLGGRLPMQDFQLDIVDKIIRKLRL
ncbi:MAG: hypothetical protein JWP06_1118 [Candidatus Saccharibacteria bacterium]|nr:hypothetical protein [Candidatus Saccharibacteria bacterium]